MAQSLTQIYLHLVFSTKNRVSFLKDPEVRSDVHAYLAGICKNQGCPAVRIAGTEDHVHVFCRLGKTVSVADLLRELKRDSSKWVKITWPNLSKFHWQNGYGAFSISSGHVDGVVKYIDNQVDHHRKETFQDELRRICRSYGIELDERYAWD